MGIATTVGVIRDFAGPYYVSEDEMAFGKPTKYWQLNPNEARHLTWDQAVYEASEEYKGHMVSTWAYERSLEKTNKNLLICEGSRDTFLFFCKAHLLTSSFYY